MTDYSQKIITISSADQDFEPHPLQFYEATHPRDAKSFIQQTIENFRLHMNKPNLRVWDAKDGQEIDLEKEDILNFDGIVLSEEMPIVQEALAVNANTRNVKGEAKVEEEPPGSRHSSAKNSFIEKKSQGPIVAVVIPRQDQMEASIDPHNENLGSSVKMALNNKLEIGTDSNIPAATNKDSVQSNNANQAVMNTIVEESTSRKNSPEKENPVVEESIPVQNQALPVVQEEPKTIETQVKPIGSTMPPTGSIGTKSIDGNDPYIYSTKTSVMPFSYLINLNEKCDEKLPSPTYLPYETLAAKRSFDKQSVFAGLEILPTGELKLTDPEILKNQKGLVKDALSSLMKSIAEGRGVVGVSLPIRIFEPRSLIERLCDFWMFVPTYVTRAAKCTDPVERMKNITAMYIAGLHLGASQLKPFNPLLGETYQATFPETGISIDLEHTSHHPPIATYCLKHPDFTMSGSYEFIGNLEGMTKNTLNMIQEGVTTFRFNDGVVIRAEIPYVILEGMMYGDRTATFSGFLKIIDETNKIKSLVKLGTIGEAKVYNKKRTDAFYGKLYKYKDMPAKKKDKDNLKFEDMDTPIAEVYGSWLEYLKIGEDEIWNLEKDKPSQYFPVENPLPSDARFREDLIWVKRNNKKVAQEWKLKLEVRQRFEKKLRTDGYKLLPPEIQKQKSKK